METFKKEKIKVLAFDIDGTLFSSENIILPTYINSIRKFIQDSGKQVEVPRKEKIMELVGLPVKQIFLRLLPELAESERDSISDSVLHLLCAEISNKKGKLYESVQETVKELHSKNYILCVASNGRRPYIDSILNTYEIKRYFQELIVIDNSQIKSKGDILNEYLQKYSVKGENVLMIGDRFSDLDAALQAGTPFAFCEFGHAEPGEIKEHSLSLNKIRDLISYL